MQKKPMFIQPISPPKRMIELTISKSESRRDGKNAGWTLSEFVFQIFQSALI